MRRALRLIAALPRRPVLGTLALILLSMSGMVATTLVVGTPVPRIYDEFAYLLTGETFAAGRLTNPTHPHWQHFETFEVIHEPTYQAKYPPAQGLFLSIGLLLGHPILGVWMSVVLMVAATAWALRSLLRPEWAFAATLLLVLQLGIASYWAQSYWGGAIAAAGGGMAFGAIARLISRQVTALDACIGGLGLALLANSRPLEGLVLTAALAGWIGLTVLRRRLRGRLLARTSVPALAVAGVGLMFAGTYNHAVTGDPTTLPYMVYEETYALAPFLILMPPPADSKHYMHGAIERQHRIRGLERHERLRDGGLLEVVRRGPGLLWSLGGGGILLLAFLPLAWNKTGTRFTFVALSLLTITVLLTPAAHPHYLAPAVVPLYFLFGLAGSSLSAKGGSRSASQVALALGTVGLVALIQLSTQLRQELKQRGDWADQRMEIMAMLQAKSPPDLVFVHYPDDYTKRIEWVYNRADIDEADVVWARPINPDADLGLIEYFGGHRVWDLIVKPGGEPHVLRFRLNPAHRAKAGR